MSNRKSYFENWQARSEYNAVSFKHGQKLVIAEAPAGFHYFHLKIFSLFFYQKWRWTFQAFRLQIRFWQNSHLPVWSGEIWREMEKSGLFVRDSIFLSLLLYEYFLFRWRRNIKLLTSHSDSASSVFTTNKKVNGITLLACSENTAIIALYTK